MLRPVQRLLSRSWFVLLLVTAVAAVLRFYALDSLPPGLYHDEAYNGLDALGVLGGYRPVFFEANNGREPLFIYMVALSTLLLGRSPLAVRAVAAVLGTLTIPATYLMVRELLGRRQALLTAGVMAITFWHVNLSRVGFRAVSLPLVAALLLWSFGRALHRKHGTDFAAAGLCLGLSLYTYLAARFLPAAIGLMVVYWLWRRQPLNGRGLLLLSTTALLVALPLILYGVGHLDAFLERSAQVSVFSPTINHGDLGGTLARQVADTLGMFNWRGDFIPRHNLPYRPVFDPAMGLFFVVGLAITAGRVRWQQESALLLTCWLVMLLPTVLAEGAPHFLRAVGLLPVLFVFPAEGLSWAWVTIGARVSRRVATTTVLVVLGLSLYTTVHDYFGRHVRSDAVYYNFESGATELAAETNRFLGTGWYAGTGVRVEDGQPSATREALFEARLWRGWPSLRYLVPEGPGLVVLDEGAARPASGTEVRITVWPFADYWPYLSALPRESLIAVRRGQLEQGDLEPEPRLLSLTYEASRPTAVPRNLGVQFEHGIELVGYDWRGQGSMGPGGGIPSPQAGQSKARVRLFWRAAGALKEDYTVFVHLLGHGQPLAQSDSYPAQGYYPTHLWRTGDVVADDHWLDAIVSPGGVYSLNVGLYFLPTMNRLRIVDAGLRQETCTADTVTINLP